MTEDILLYALVGFVAQLVDGAIGMAFGVISTSVLLALGVPPAVASAGVHAAEVVTTAISGISHWIYGNVDKRLFLRLAVAGVIGGVTGAYVLTQIPGKIAQPAVAIYLCAMAALIVYKAFVRRPAVPVTRGVVPLGMAGGFLDAVGGGGWGPIVVSNLVARGNSPRYTIGSVNLAEFFVTLAISIAFFFTIAPTYFVAAAGLILGGALAAPLAGWMTKRLPPRLLMLLVGLVVLSLGTLGIVRLAVS
ncbi:MAG: sulfite exporter TauE/SafE family protein [Candidatus Odyssella sp.]|nr:sulfite exporter TauE/SafE family protein [Candidatus Odyssella sp.]